MNRRIFFYGDSNVWGYMPEGGRIKAQDRFPFQAGRMLPGCEIVECGLNGRCTAYSHEVFSPALLGGATFRAEFAKALPVDALVIMLGTNDVMDPLNFTARKIAGNLQRMIREAREAAGPDLAVLLVCPPPLPTRGVWELVGMYGCEKDLLEQDLAPALAKAAAEEGAHFLDAKASVPEFDAEDGFHLSVDSHRSLGRACGEVLRHMLLG